MRSRRASLFGVAAMLLPGLASAQSGVWAEGTAKVGYMTGAYDLGGSSARLDGLAFAFGGALGFAPSKHWAIAPGAGMLVANAHRERVGAAEIDGVFGPSLGLDVALRPTGEGWLVRSSVGMEWIDFFGGVNGAGTASALTDIERVRGPRFALAVGWTGPIVGVSLGAAHSRLKGDHSTFRPFVVTVALVLHRWPRAE